MGSKDDKRVGPDKERQFDTPPSIVVDVVL